jgi:predicted AlkP superfamily pyrophosphatase or phosphodiesterase
MPDLLFIHFHDVDDQGHSYGPDSPQYEEAIIRVDSYLSQILDALPSNTFITIFADHGMQADLASNGGNHGQLTESAMVIPIIFIKK